MSAPDPLAAALDALAIAFARRVVEELHPLLAAQGAAAHMAAPLADRHELARVLGVSTATIARLQKDGAPHSFVGVSPRFDVEAVRGWLATRGRAGAHAASPKKTTVAGVRLLSRGSRSA